MSTKSDAPKSGRGRKALRGLDTSTPPHLSSMAPKKVKTVQETVSTSLGPNIKEGELVFGVARIFASFNDVRSLHLTTCAVC